MKRLLLIFIFSVSIFAQDVYRMDVNQIILPFNKEGVLADLTIDPYPPGGRFAENNKGYIFSAGFFLSGKNTGAIWVNGIVTASRIQDYLAGNVDSLPSNPKYKLYILKASDNDFSQSWIDWIDAVNIGADFYDGNNDGIYNPVDLNGNNQWDPDEDRPDLIGDLTAWCVYNDGVPSALRMFNDVEPQGIEIHQTVFAFIGDNSGYDGRDYTFFVRYKIINKGTVLDVFDSVYFGGWADTDLGETNDSYVDDLAGCDTLLNSGYIYNDGDDLDWGINPPAHFIKILQGPYSYIPGETFIDNNSNEEYEEGIDTPLDSAYNYMGVTGIDTLPGAKNLGISSFVHNMSSSPAQGDPGNHTAARNYMLGKQNNGNDYNPCTWPLGTVLGGVNCAEVNPIFMYSGDPVNQTGWINISPNDQRQLSNTDPFKLKAGEPVNIIVAHIAGRGYNALNSITISRVFSSSLDEYLKSNFTNIPVSIDDEISDLTPTSFKLSQNYPNPFNPITKIKYTIPNVTLSKAEGSLVSLKVFDVLGNEIATLVNEEKPAGSYEIAFDASALSSGIYLYELRTVSFIQTKKMILLK